MIISILEAHVEKENWPVLQKAFIEIGRHREPGLVESFLVQGVKEATLWRIVTIWQSREALDAMRSSGEPPRGLLMFRQAGAEPQLVLFDVVGYRPGDEKQPL